MTSRRFATIATNSIFNLEKERVCVPEVISDTCMQMAAVSYECETWPFLRNEKCSFGIYEIKNLRRKRKRKIEKIT
jgi:hypothetical protein